MGNIYIYIFLNQYTSFINFELGKRVIVPLYIFLVSAIGGSELNIALFLMVLCNAARAGWVGLHY